MFKRIFILALLCLMLALLSSAALADVPIDATHFSDDAFRNHISQNYDIDYASFSDGILTDSEISQITELNLMYCGIKSLKGIEYLTSLKSLICDNNALTDLDLSRNTALVTLKETLIKRVIPSQTQLETDYSALITPTCSK